MDPDILAMMDARPEEGGGSRRSGAAPETLAKARAQSPANRKARKEASKAVSDEGARLAALCIPGVASLVQLGGKTEDQRRLDKLIVKARCRLAVSPRIRGSGPAVEKVRKLQATSCTLLSSATLTNQRRGLEAWLQACCREGVSHRVLGFAAMWDEVSQKLKAMLTNASGSASASTATTFQTSAPKDVQVMCTLGSVHSMEAWPGDDGSGHLGGKVAAMDFPSTLHGRNEPQVLDRGFEPCVAGGLVWRGRA